MLALAESDGSIEGSIKGLAHEARVTLTECKTALEILKAPDPYSRTTDNDGRRIKEMPGGWIVLNHKLYREKAKSRAEYYKKWRDSKKEKKEDNNTKDVNVNSNSNSETARNNAQQLRKEQKKETKPHSTTSSERIISAWQKLPLPLEKKSFGSADILAIERQLSVLAEDPIEPLHESMILEAIENYGKALNLPSSQTYKHKLYSWLFKGHVRKYMSYAFDIDHHDSSKFRKGKGTDIQTEYEKLKASGDL